MEITCKNCGNTFEDKFCNHCGQKNFTDKDKSFKHILDEVIHFLTHFEGSFIRTFKAVISKPGQLSKDYCEGKRKTYYKPISFFLLIVIVYLIFPFAKGMNQTLASHQYNKIAGELIQQQVASRMAAEHLGEEILSEKFEKLSGKTSKILMLLLIPLSALFIFMLFFRHKKFAFDYFILATEFNSFMMLSFFLLLPLLIFPVFLLFRIPDHNIDNTILPFLAAIILIYTIMLFRRFFSEKWILTILKSLIFCSIYALFVIPFYQFIIFEVTFALI